MTDDELRMAERALAEVEYLGADQRETMARLLAAARAEGRREGLDKAARVCDLRALANGWVECESGDATPRARESVSCARAILGLKDTTDDA